MDLLQDSQPSTQGCSLSPEWCPQHGMSSEITAGKSGSGRGAEPCPQAEDQEFLFPIRHAKALSPAKPQGLFLPLASKGWQQKHVQGRRSSVKEGSGFLLGLCDLFWFGKNRDVQRCSQCTARLFPLPQQQNKPHGLLSVTGNWSPEPQPNLWLLGWNQKYSFWELVPLLVCKENLCAAMEPHYGLLVFQPWFSGIQLLLRDGNNFS